MPDPRHHPKIQDLIARLRSALDPCTIYLFGSHAIGSAAADSDFDVLVVVPSGRGSDYELRRRGHAALLGFGHPVDLLIYSQAEWDYLAPKQYSVARQVHDTGIVLHAAA
jgi:predicted nucleotidyltransferase